MPAPTRLDDLFLKELRDLYDGERQVGRSFSRMMGASASEEVRAALEDHLDETCAQIERLEQIFDGLELQPRGTPCAGVAGILDGSAALVDGEGDALVRDLGIVAGAGRLEHYQIATYALLVALARRLGKDEAAALLEQNLAEEEAAGRQLSELAESLLASPGSLPS